jgi:acid stress-induced BolA-like protein IbaG/YrbA
VMARLPGTVRSAASKMRVMADPTPLDVRTFIEQGLACVHVDVDGDGRHFFATIVSAAFEGTTRVARQRLVYQALGDRMREQIHALSMKTLSPAEWAAAQPPGAVSAVVAPVVPPALHH